MSIRLKIIGTLTLIIPVMVVFLTLFQIAQKKNEEQRIGIVHSYQVIDQINVLLSDMQDAETGQRGFIITNDKSFLEPYNWSVKKADVDLAQLRQLTQTNVSQQQRLNEFEPLMRNKLSHMAGTIALRDEQGLQAAAKRVVTKTGKALMDRMRAILGEMISEERLLVTEQEKKYNQTLAVLYKGEAVFIAAMSVISLIIGFLLIRSIMRPLRALSQGAGKLGAGDYATRISFSSRDEFSRLATAFNRMAAAIQVQTQELNSVVSTMADGLIIVDNEGGIRSLNPAAERMFGVAAGELVGKPFNYLLPQWNDDEHRALTASTGYRCETNGQRKDGSLFPVALAFSEMSVDGNRLFTCLLRDISAQKNAQMELTAALARTEASDRIKSAILNHAGHAIIASDPEGIIHTFNPAAERMLGYSAAEMMGLTPAIFHDPQEVEARAKQFSVELGETITPGFEVFVARSRRNLPNEYEWTYRRKDGTRFPVQLSVTALRDAAGGITGFLGMASDITVQKSIQMELANNETRLRTVIETVVEGIITIDSKGNVETMNPAAEKIFNYQANEVIGRNINMLMPEPYHSQHDAYLLHYLTTGQAKVIGIGREVVGRRKEGSVFPMELAVSEMSIDGRRKFTGLVRDISERKAMERMKNEFISTVSHELRTPLTSIQGALGLILGGATGELPEKSLKLLTIASNNCKRLVRLINDILDLEKIESGKMIFDSKAIEIMPLVQHAIDSNQAYADEFGVTFAVTHEHPGAVVLADNDRLTQVLTNLLSNAAKFSHRGGRVDVAVSSTEQRLRVSVTDYGAGIQEAFRSRIFKKFTQEDGTNTRQKGGTGLGLSISKAIIEQLGGVINYESEPGKQTTFFFELPLYRTEQALPATQTDEHGKEHLLILEDDPDVANLLRMMLEKRGYTADIAYNAEQAKQMLGSRHYDALTLDLMLPGQNGIDFFRELHAQECFKDLPVIVVSALVDQGKHELNGDAVDIVDWLSKPIDEDRLEQAVAYALRRNGARTRILHVEDDPDIVHIVGTLLQHIAQVDVATNLATAREKLQQDYDLVILDMGLPDGSGEDLLPLLVDRDKAIPVVIFSAHEINTADSQHVLANFIKSKTSNDVLMNKIEAILKNRRQI